MDVSRSPAVIQAFTIMNCLNDSREALRLSTIAQRSGLPKSSTYRLLNSLVEAGAVRATNNGYRLGEWRRPQPPVWSKADLITQFYRIVRQIGIEDTVQLAVLDHTVVTFIACVDSTNPVRLITSVGRKLPAHATAAGKILLAHSSDEIVDDVVAAGLPRTGPRTITDPSAFRQQLSHFAAVGWAWEREESSENLSCVAAPILTRRGDAVASVTLCTPQGKPEEAQEKYRGARILHLAEKIGQSLAAQVPVANHRTNLDRVEKIENLQKGIV